MEQSIASLASNNTLIIGIYFKLLFLRKLPVKAPKPPSKPPTNPVIITRSVALPFKGNILATLVDKRCWLGTSLASAQILHNKNKAINPTKNDGIGCCFVTMAVANAAITKLYQGKKLMILINQQVITVMIIERKNFILRVYD
jgi:hypothetical protein